MTSNKEILAKIGTILSDLLDQHKHLSQNLESINDLEIELLTANVTFLSDHLAILQKILRHSTTTGMKAANQTVEQLMSLAQQSSLAKSVDKFPPSSAQYSGMILASAGVHQNKNSNNPAVPFTFDKKNLEELYDRPLTLAEKQIIGQKIDGNRNKVDPHVITSSQKRNIVKPQFAKQARDLKTLIDLNDKLLFIRDLFNAYALAYSEAMDLINQFHSFEEVHQFLQKTYSQKYNWNTKKNSVDRFYKILSQGFILNDSHSV